MSIIIFGASGFIGSHLYQYFSKDSAIGTYNNSPKKGLIHFDMESSSLEELELKNVRYGIICSAFTNMDSCKTDEFKAHNVNVKGTIRLIAQLFKFDIIPIFLSTDFVFDGERGSYTESDKRKPVLKYGEFKKEVEDFLIKSNKTYIIARVGKVYGLTAGDGTLLTWLVEELKKGNTVKCAVDQIFSFTYVKDAARAIDTAIGKGLCGCYNIASPESFSRYEIAKMLKNRLGIMSGKIEKCSIKDFNFADFRPLNTSLNSEKFIKATGFKFSRLGDNIDMLKKIY